MTRRGLTTAVLASLLATTGCAATHSSTATSPSPIASAQWDPTKMPDPCRVITASEVGAAIGTPVSAGTRLQTWPPLCRFVIDNDSHTFVYMSDDSRPTAVDDFERNGHTTDPTQPVSGVGDRAYWLPRLTTLHCINA